MSKNKIKAVVDTNVFIGGLFQDQESASIVLEMIENREIKLYFSQQTIGELIYLVKNFARHNIKTVDEQLYVLHSIVDLFYYSMSVNTLDIDCPKTKDEFDDMFVECAVKGKVNYIISDDFKSGIHNLQLGDIKIMGTNEFIEHICCDN